MITAAAAATAAAANTVRSTKLMAILKQKDDFPEHQQNKINDLVEEFLQKLRNDVHKTITAQDADTYTGLDSKRDTNQQVRTMLQFFPETMEQKKVMKWDSDLGIWNHARGDGDYPINCLSYMFSTRTKRGICNVMAAPFIHIFAQVAIDCGLFKNNNNNNNNNVDGTVVSTTTKQGEEQEQQSQRGGLVIDNETWENTLQCLVCCSDPPRVVEDDNNNNTNINANNDDEKHEQHQQLVDTVFLSELVQLRRMNLFKKEDILKYNLMYGLYSNVYFPKKRFEFLAEFDPVCLLPQQQIRNNNSDDDDDANPNDVTEDCTLLHFAAIDTSIEPFRCVLDYTIRYYPLWKGITLLFKQETSREEDDDDDDDDDDNDNAVDSDTMHSDIDGLNNIVGNRVRGVDLLLHRNELFAAFLNNYYGELGRIILDNGDDNNDNNNDTDDDNVDNNGNVLNDDNNNDGEDDDDGSSSSSVIEEDTDDDTPFQIACNEHGREEVMDVVNTVLATYSSTTGGTTTAATTTATQLRTVEALIVACTDETIHLDCVFFLLRREPHILNGLVVPTPSVSKDNDDDGTDDDNNTGRADDDDWTLVKKKY